MVGDSELHVCSVAAGREGGAVVRHEVGLHVEGVADGQSDVLVLGSVLDGVLANELQRLVSGVLLEDAHCAFGQRHAHAGRLGVVEPDLAGGLDVVLRVAACVYEDLVELADGHVVDFGDELHLLFGRFVKSNRLGKSVHMVVCK